MSLLYLILIENFLDGYFELGRMIDLAQSDIIAFLLWWILRCELWRVRRLKNMDSVGEKLS